MNNPKVRKDYRFPGMDRNKPLVLDENYCVTTSEASGGGVPVVNVAETFKSYSQTEITDESTKAALDAAAKSHLLIAIVPVEGEEAIDYFPVMAQYVSIYETGYEVLINLPASIGGTLMYYVDGSVSPNLIATYEGGSSS